jgi:FMN phosphatase YigB (HAD superfamily)
LNCDYYVAKADKPSINAFERVRVKFGLDKSQMAHIGNKMRKDVRAANEFGIISVLVRNIGSAENVGKKVLRLFGKKSKGHQIRSELKARGLWRKHHKYCDNDQFYQLGEEPPYIEETSRRKYEAQVAGYCSRLGS